MCFTFTLLSSAIVCWFWDALCGWTSTNDWMSLFQSFQKRGKRAESAARIHCIGNAWLQVYGKLETLGRGLYDCYCLLRVLRMEALLTNASKRDHVGLSCKHVFIPEKLPTCSSWATKTLHHQNIDEKIKEVGGPQLKLMWKRMSQFPRISSSGDYPSQLWKMSRKSLNKCSKPWVVESTIELNVWNGFCCSTCSLNNGRMFRLSRSKWTTKGQTFWVIHNDYSAMTKHMSPL